ncbi:helix-turn-helix domain-containing protein [Cohnella mopanensis]|uniref:helix-turn-helix domain-containing protein n=1 Tax=Cohnella mopanensis TaxID=2911966 RepID=UPI001EF7EC0B|nr:AraC family transcriptional regulator [Cohnella mopanensis]
MMPQFEKALPAHFIDFRSSIKEDASSNYRLIWHTDANDQAVICVTLVAPHIRLRAEELPRPHCCIDFYSSFLTSMQGTMPQKRTLRISVSSYAHDILTMLSSLAHQPAFRQRQVRFSIAITSLLAELLDDLRNEQKPDPAIPKKGHSEGLRGARAILYATRYMKKHMSDPQLSLQDIAGAIGYNSNYFCREFSKIFSVSPIRFLNQLRVYHTLRLLEQSDMGVGAICLLVGFTNPSRLSSMVKAASGMTPLQFRRSKKMQSLAEKEPSNVDRIVPKWTG